ncbi:hypothetical protein JHN52_01100 [Streptomyces sp. MBT97]|uniref:hypothetical protein n=1 Tax=Streptomyces sp. MBT97 TaxID=2800411 RepID=UPI00190A5208|nr:hypothetical protein [Streptomyces sp. MBT97]MBK3631578.1 hypothetical protein [Streptomyces sp. MBT97]
MGPLNWGDVPTAVGALFAGGAAWFAYQTIKSQRQQITEQRSFIGEQIQFMSDQRENLLLERAELRNQADERHVAQAQAVKMVAEAHGSSGTSPEGDPIGFDSWHVLVLNRSSEPITDVMVRFGDTYNAASARVFAIRPPDTGLRPLPVHLIPDGGEVSFFSPRWSETTVENNRPALLFTDAAGTRWRRSYDGKLEEVPS